jgi:hypothetical protein
MSATDALVEALEAASLEEQKDQEPQYVYLKCVKTSLKLRVRIVTPGYLLSANCQFPRDLRVQGRYYRVTAESVKLQNMRGRYFYCIKNKKDITIVTEADIPKPPPPKIRVYEDTEQEECLICFDAVKEAVFNPCGHYYTCHACSKRCTRCPVCRHPVVSIIDKKDLD